MKKLWQKNYAVNKFIEHFTVGQDYLLDRQLIGADCAGSIAHLRMLNKQGYLDKGDATALETTLQKIFKQFQAEKINIQPSQEDCHTFIEQTLVEDLGEAGLRIHLGRSRNDQSYTALRLYGREYLLEIQLHFYDLIQTILNFAESNSRVPMPGRTHTQLAMPSTVGLWAGAFVEEFLDVAQCLKTVFELFNRSPLGGAAGYGVPLNIDREYSARLMGFPSVQNNVLAVQNSRGRLDAQICDLLDHIGLLIGKAAQDLILFSMPEFGYFSIPDELCTGSSIMPQKKNPDGLELLRSRTALISGWVDQMKKIIRSLPSGYNRDLQDTKEAFFRCFQTILDCIQIAELMFRKIIVNEKKLRSAHVPEIFATDEAIRLVKEGMPFRLAYREVGIHLDYLDTYDLDNVIASRNSTGYPANLGLERSRTVLNTLRETHSTMSEQHFTAMHNLLGDSARLIRMYETSGKNGDEPNKAYLSHAGKSEDEIRT